MLPFFVTIAILVPLFTGGGYLFQSLIQEKNSRIMELLLVSVRPRQLLTGQLLGLGALTLVQYLIWAVIGLVALVVAGADIPASLSEVRLSAGELLAAVLFALGGFSLYAALMSGIGALAPDLDNSRTWIFIITLPMMIPLYTWIVIVNAPHSFLAVTLSLFPFSAPVAMLLRMTSTAVPVWQVGLSLILLALAAVVTIWLMARLFRAQTLLSGEPLSLRRMWSALVAPAA
jgi:ABC-2 type transport system permease protein